MIMDGILNIYKEKDYTSFDVVAIVRKIMKQKKVGHTGTLDPQAEGVLPVCVGKATKISDFIMAETKEYLAQVTLGLTTTTQDHTGEVLERRDVCFDETLIQQAVESFIGEYKQVPPMYSAIKVNGKKLYELARQGKEIEREARPIQIYDIQIKRFLPPNQFEMLVSCSKGTYIRTLCHDIGKKLGCGAIMSGLVRTRSGLFSMENAITLEELKQRSASNQLDEVLISLDEILRDYKKIKTLAKGDSFLHNGGRVYAYCFSSQCDSYEKDDIVRAYDSTNHLIGLHKVCWDEEKKNLCIAPVKMLI